MGLLSVIFGRKKPVSLGARGEGEAVRFLKGKGWKILLVNFRIEGVGEIDVIAREPGGVVVFVEVKTRSGVQVNPGEQVDARKEGQVVKVARVYLKKYGEKKPKYRFDVVSIVWVKGEEPLVEHWENAFGE